MFQCYVAIIDSVNSSFTPKMSKKAHNGQNLNFPPHPHGNQPKMNIIIKNLAGVVGIDLTNSALVLLDPWMDEYISWALMKALVPWLVSIKIRKRAF